MSKNNEKKNSKESHLKKIEFNAQKNPANNGVFKKIDKKMNKKISQNRYSKKTNANSKLFHVSLTTNKKKENDYNRLKHKIEDIENYNNKQHSLQQHFKFTTYEFEPKNITEVPNNVFKNCLVKKNSKENSYKKINHYRDLYRYNKMNKKKNTVQNNIFISNYSIISNNNSTNNFIVNKKNLDNSEKENKNNVYSKKKINVKAKKINKNNNIKNDNYNKNISEKIIDDRSEKEKNTKITQKEENNNIRVNTENNDFEKYKNYINKDILDDYLNYIHSIETPFQNVDQKNEPQKIQLQNNQNKIANNEIKNNDKNEITNEKTVTSNGKKDDISSSKLTTKLTNSKIVQKEKDQIPKNININNYNNGQQNNENLTKFKNSYNESSNDKNKEKQKEIEKLTIDNNNNKNINQIENIKTVDSSTQKEFNSFLPNKTFKKFIKNKLKYYIKEEEIPDQILSNFANYQNEFNNNDENNLLKIIPASSINDKKPIIQEISTPYDPEYEMMDKYYDTPKNINNNKILKKNNNLKFKTQNDFTKINKIAEIDLYESEKKHLIDENQKLLGRLDKIENIINDTRNEITKKNEKIRTVINEYDSINRENESNKKKIDNLKYEIFMKDKMVSNKKNLLNQLKDININLESKITQIQEKYDNEANSNKSTEKNLYTMENQYQSVKNKYNNLNKKYKKVTKENLLLQKNQKNYEEEIKSKNKLINNLINNKNLSYDKPNENINYEYKNFIEKGRDNFPRGKKNKNKEKKLNLIKKNDKNKYLNFQNIDLNNI